MKVAVAATETLALVHAFERALSSEVVVHAPVGYTATARVSSVALVYS